MAGIRRQKGGLRASKKPRSSGGATKGLKSRAGHRSSADSLLARGRAITASSKTMKKGAYFHSETRGGKKATAGSLPPSRSKQRAAATRARAINRKGPLAEHPSRAGIGKAVKARKQAQSDKKRHTDTKPFRYRFSPSGKSRPAKKSQSNL